jgi:A/G-specific adenine glycosylase
MQVELKCVICYIVAVNIFTKKLLTWHEKQNTRALPWKQEKDPYKIWISEIMLQQTQAATVVDYYLTFTKKYPTIKSLAAAKDDDVLKLWEGLGYYSRCRNILFTARDITQKYKGVFPSEYEQILALKGIGEYTAAAISSFAFDMPYAVVDGNVLRILSRYFGIEEAVDIPSVKKEISALAQTLLNKKNPAAYNQAIMDFGATVCKPKLPLCASCTLQKECEAYEKDLVHILPLKQKTITVKERHFHFLLLDDGEGIYLQQRTAQDVWQGLYQLPLHEGAMLSAQITPHIIDLAFEYKQRLTHQLLQVKVYTVKKSALQLSVFTASEHVKYNTIAKKGMPKSIVMALKKLAYI